jgi:hypothetical protein
MAGAFMRFGRFISHAAGHNWFAAAIDVVVLVVGIFLGMQVNNWNQARIDREKGHEYRLRLINEIRTDEVALTSRKLYFSEVLRHAKEALAALDRPANPDGAAFLIDAYQASQITPTRPARAVYEEIVSTGNAQNLGNAALREQVANYYTVQASTAVVLDFVPPYREHLRQSMPSAAQEAIRAQCPEIWHLGAAGLYTLELPARCSLVLDPAKTSEAVRAVRASDDLKRDLTRIIADLDGKITIVDALLVQAHAIRSKIASAER